MVWNALRHPNVLPLLGVMMTEAEFVMVSDWMEDGNIKDFLKSNDDADWLELVCFPSGVLTFTRH